MGEEASNFPKGPCVGRGGAWVWWAEPPTGREALNITRPHYVAVLMISRHTRASRS